MEKAEYPDFFNSPLIFNELRSRIVVEDRLSVERRRLEEGIGSMKPRALTHSIDLRRVKSKSEKILKTFIRFFEEM